MNDLALNLPPHRMRHGMGRRVALPLDLLGWLLWGMDIVLIAGVGIGLAIDRHIVLVALMLYPAIASLSGAYDADGLFSMRRALPRMMRSWIACILFTVGFQILLNSQIPMTVGHVLAWAVSTLVALFMVRGLSTLSARRLRQNGHFNQRLAIYGATPSGASLHSYVTAQPALTLDVVGIYDERNPTRVGNILERLPFRGNLDALIRDIRAGAVDQVIIALPWSEEIYVRNVVNRLTLTPVRIRLLPDATLLAYPQRPMVMLGELPMITLFERPISGLDAIIKRIEDLILAGFLILLAMPLLGITALAIRLDSEGPVFFRQPREGFNNQHFRIWKFRSMYVADSETRAVTQATRGDPRITRVGRFIRATSIDELPQLFNVLSGEMSLVGPRPHAPSTRAGEKYFPDVINTYAARHKVKPGITGWAQANGWRGETDTEEKLIQRVNHDLYYIENWSVWLDVYILMRTLLVLVGSHVY